MSMHKKYTAPKLTKLTRARRYDSALSNGDGERKDRQRKDGRVIVYLFIIIYGILLNKHRKMNK